MIIFGIDMGVKSTCVSVIEVKNNKIKILKCEMAPFSIMGMSKAEMDKANIFRHWFRGLLKKYHPDLVSPETFMARSHRSNLGMPISCLIGMMKYACLIRNIEFFPTMPSQWKRSLKKEIQDVTLFYDMSYPVKQRLPNHAVDSLLMAIFQSPKGFKCVSKKKIDTMLKLLKDSIFVPPLSSAVAVKKKGKKKKG